VGSVRREEAVAREEPSSTPKGSLQALYDAFLERLISAREEAGMTQREVSALMGRSHSFLSKCETGERSIEVFELLQIAQLYGKPPQYFLDLDWPQARKG
jgi:transcriptional regulator with XRE-family HTH domain